MIYKIVKIAREDNLKSYSQIVGFIEGKEKVKKTTFSSELKYVVLIVIIFCILVTLGQALGSLLFFK